MNTKSRLSGKLQLAFGSAILAPLAMDAISCPCMFLFGPTILFISSTEDIERGRSMEVFQ